VQWDDLWVFVPEKREEPELKGHFQHPRMERKVRGGIKDQRGQISDQKLIDAWPEIVDQEDPGERLGGRDTVERAGKTAYIATFVDKTTKLLKGKVMPNKAAATLNKAAIRMFQSIPDEYIKI
jgi:IS30 family transposase